MCVAAFAASMPAEYRASFDHASVAAHAAIAKARSDKSTHVAIWRELPRMVGVCVVAVDHPGLLAPVSAALVAHDIDVVSANAYTRTLTNGKPEAFDLLWLRRMSTSIDAHLPIGPRDITRVAEMVDALVSGRTTFPGAVRASRAATVTASTTPAFSAKWSWKPRSRAMTGKSRSSPPFAWRRTP
jgi:UTP:GlnB (protein PII) uridylyltransferase